MRYRIGKSSMVYQTIGLCRLLALQASLHSSPSSPFFLFLLSFFMFSPISGHSHISESISMKNFSVPPNSHLSTLQLSVIQHLSQIVF